MNNNLKIILIIKETIIIKMKKKKMTIIYIIESILGKFEFFLGIYFKNLLIFLSEFEEFNLHKFE